MTETPPNSPEDFSQMTACQLKSKGPNPEIDELFENPQFVCGNCGSKTHSAANLCNPEAL